MDAMIDAVNEIDLEKKQEKEKGGSGWIHLSRQK